MGEVYRATDSKLGREVAIKLIPEDFAKDSTRMSRFTREAQVLASLNHPNIAAIYGVEDRALIMELVEGQTLAERIKQGPVPLDEALEFARQISEGLEAAHEKGVVHRDLKPANIKITPGGVVKLLDFGLAKSDSPWAAATPVDDTPTLTVASTGAGVILGTAAYMAPEQARGRNVDRRADIWAFGVIVYEMLTGSQLFGGETVTDVLASVVRVEPDLNKVPAKVRTLLRRCLEKDPKRRLRDASDAMLLLDAGIEETAAAPATRGLLWTLAGTTLALLAGLVWLAWVHFREVAAELEPVRFQIGLPDNVRFTQSGVSAISPDGRQIAFAAYGSDGEPRIWIRPLDSPTATPLAEATISQLMLPFFWSPDGRYIAFEARDGKFKKIDVASGKPEVLVDERQQILGGSWNRDNTIIFGSAKGIQRVSADGGKVTPVTTLAKGELIHLYPVFLPDGRHFLYMRGSTVGNRFLTVGDLNAAPATQTTTPLLKTDFAVTVASPTAGGAPKMLFLRDGMLMAQDFEMNTLTPTGPVVSIADQIDSLPNASVAYFSVSNTGTLVYRTIAGRNRQLTWFSRSGEVIGTPGERAPYNLVKVSPDGTKAAVVEVDSRQQPANPDIWIVDLMSGSRTRLTFDPGVDSTPVWSPDSTAIAWLSFRGTAPGFYRKAINGSGTEELLATPEAVNNLTDWSRDGYLIYAPRGDIWALPVNPDATGKRTPVPVVQGPAQEFGAYVSSDSKWIGYISNETGRQEIFVQPFAPGGNKSGGKWLVSNGTLGMARWRADSKELMFVGADGGVMAVDVTSSGQAFQVSAPHKLFQLPLELLGVSNNPGTLIDVTRDNQRLLIIMPVQENSERELSVFMNWPTALRK